MATKTPPPPTAAQFWKANPILAQRAIQYLSQHSTNQGLQNQVLKSPQQFQQLSGRAENRRNFPSDHHVAAGIVNSQLGALKQQGVDEQTARTQLLVELMRVGAGRKKDQIVASEQLTDPIEQLYKQAGDPTAEAIVKLGGTIADPYETLKKGSKAKDAEAALTAAVFARSPLGQKALAENNPKAAAAMARVQLENQIVQRFTQITGQGGVADQYDAYLADKRFRSTATAAEKRAAGPALADPLTALGLTRSNLGVPTGQPVTGSTIRAAMIAQLEKERGSLRQLGKPGDPGFATGVPIPGTQVAKFITSLEKAGVVGKQLAKAMRSGGLTGGDAFTAYQELLASGQLDPTLSGAVTSATAAAKAGTSGAVPGAGPVA